MVGVVPLRMTFDAVLSSVSTDEFLAHDLHQMNRQTDRMSPLRLTNSNCNFGFRIISQKFFVERPIFQAIRNNFMFDISTLSWSNHLKNFIIEKN